APNVGSSPRRIHRRISGYVPVDGTQVTEPQASKMWNYFFPGPLQISSMHPGDQFGFKSEKLYLLNLKKPCTVTPCI
ncbi:MAG: hypothetical protein PVG81_15065, partial [Desulfobacterales bacterium]